MKASFILQTKQHCQGCGSVFIASAQLEPMKLEKEISASIVMAIEQSLSELESVDCQRCNQKTKQVDVTHIREY
jgi:hypothetical protein